MTDSVRLAISELTWADLRRHLPDQTPGQCLFKCPAGERFFGESSITTQPA